MKRIYFIALAVLNSALAISLHSITKLSRSLFERALANPEALPPMTTAALAFYWWPWIFAVISVAVLVASFLRKIEDESLMHWVAGLCIIEGVLLLPHFWALWMPIYSILAKMVS